MHATDARMEDGGHVVTFAASPPLHFSPDSSKSTPSEGALVIGIGTWISAETGVSGNVNVPKVFGGMDLGQWPGALASQLLFCLFLKMPRIIENILLICGVADLPSILLARSEAFTC